MRHKIIAVLACACTLIMLLASCGLSSGGKERPYLEDRIYETGVLPNDCYLCGANPDSPFAPYWGQANLGLVNMNTMECNVLDVNRYERTARLLIRRRVTDYLRAHGAIQRKVAGSAICSVRTSYYIFDTNQRCN